MVSFAKVFSSNSGQKPRIKGGNLKVVHPPQTILPHQRRIEDVTSPVPKGAFGNLLDGHGLTVVRVGAFSVEKQNLYDVCKYSKNHEELVTLSKKDAEHLKDLLTGDDIRRLGLTSLMIVVIVLEKDGKPGEVRKMDHLEILRISLQGEGVWRTESDNPKLVGMSPECGLLFYRKNP